MRKAALLISLLILLCGGSLASANPGSPETPDARLRFAAAQHEIISILITEQQFDRILSEYQKILDLGFSGSNEELVVKEAWSIARSLAELNQFRLAYRVLDATLQSVTERESGFALLMFKGKLLKQEGRTNEALAVYRQAQSLQQ